ncbi:MAG: cytochrome c1 [Pseudomonadales bacterium]|nr:cytochrome c1 [Pseudomonadales bacterium]MCP5185365.1 cytochrome c1 [Pseudomonadales bacterium]
MVSVFAGLVLAGGVWASETAVHMEPMHPDAENLPSLQNGFKLYANYCLGCHSLKFQRYERTADDLAIPHDVALETVVFTGQKIGELMVNSMNPEGAKSWFGAPPPDLTMVTRVRGPEWVYNYLKTFYIDESRPFGVNNDVFPNVGMPHVLMSLQGVQRKGCVQKPVLLPNGAEKRDELIPGKAVTEEKCGQLYVEEGSGALDEKAYDQAVYDLVNFLSYVGEPSKLDRHRIGIYVLLFLVILGCFTYLLNREYWKDVH